MTFSDRPSSFRGNIEIDATEGGAIVGDLHYNPQPDAQGFYLSYVHVVLGHERRGISAKLIEEFVQRIGRGQRVHGTIAHKPTLEILLKTKRLEEAFNSGSITITDASELQTLPIVHVLQRGGITVSDVQITRTQQTGPQYTSFATIQPQVIGDFSTFFQSKFHGRT